MSAPEFQLRPSVRSIRLALLLLSSVGISSASAQEASSENVLPVIQVVQQGEQAGFSTQKVNTTKSDKPLFETPQSISVITRDLMDARQATSLNEAIETVAGVTSSSLGRRGWDDFLIRGQTASDTMYLDGLRIGQGNWVAQEIYGAERLEVIKGPASIYFGQVTPGGTVNIISKRPTAEAFNQVGFTVGDYGYMQGTFDFNRPLNSANGKAAIRINGMAMNSDDPTVGVWYKNRYIAPSISLDLGARTDFTILTAINQRNYIRQQGIPLAATSLVNNGVRVANNYYAGSNTIAPYDAEQKSIGYVLAHRFDSGWTLNQTYRHLEMDMTGQLANTSGAVNIGTGAFGQNVLSQKFWGRSDGLDTNVTKAFNLGGARHTVTVGVDTMYDVLNQDSRRCTIANQNIYRPNYNRPVGPCSLTSITDTKLAQTGLYLRDYIDFNEKLSLSASLRQDRSRISTYTVAPNKTTAVSSEKDATTGHAGLIYKVTQNIAPYLSYATSFYPQSDLTYPGTPIDPEQGKQKEIGVKLLSDDKRLSASFAYYDLVRKNVKTADLVNTDFFTTIGEQRTKGYEAEVSADLKNGWQLSGALSILDAFVTQANAAQQLSIGQPLSNIPKKSASIFANYTFTGALQGWATGFGIRYVDQKISRDAASALVYYTVPSYTVADANVSYQGKGYRVQLNVKNLFDKDYYAGASGQFWVPAGNPRTVMLRTVFDF
ncbi:Ferrichrome-iron receptor precursor [compost metagenome]